MTDDSMSRRRFLAASAAGTAGAVVLGSATGPLAGTAAAAPAGETARGAARWTPSGLLTSLLPDGLGVRAARPRLSWQVADLGPGTKQTHYQLQFATAPHRLARGPHAWDSGRVASAGSVAVPYGGPALAPETAYWWRVRTFDGPRASRWSEPALLATGVAEWAADPIWTPPAQAPADGVLTAGVRIASVAASLWFRASGSGANYLWQLRAGTPGVLKKHVCVDGAYRVLEEKALAIPVETGRRYDIAIEMSGDTFTTSIDGAAVDTTTDGTHRTGTVGMRNGSSESNAWDRVTFTAADGTTVLDEDFATGRGTFSAGTVEDGALTLGRGEATLSSAGAPDDDWALLRTEFTLARKEIAAAVLHVAAQSPEPTRQYPAKIWANGEVAGFASMRSGAGAPKYHSFDVTRLLRPGRRNALAALAFTTADKRFVARLVVTHTDGTTATVDTGRAWKARRQAGMLRDAGTIGTGYYHCRQEYWDMRHEPAGWTYPGFDDAAWEPAAVRDAIDGLEPALVEPVGLYDVRPASVRRTAPGTWLVDLGREIVGGLRLSVRGRAGQTVEVRLGEELNDDGTVRYDLRAQVTYREVWTLRDGRQSIEHWGYRGFRYAQLVTDDDLDLAGAVTGRFWRAGWDGGAASFASSDPDLDRVYALCRYSIEATRGDLYIDTPTRERGPYEGDALINQASEYGVQRSFALARASDAFLARNHTWPTEYRLMNVMSAWQDYLHTGDPEQLAADHDVLAGKHLTEFLGDDGLVHKDPGRSSQDLGDLVDWPASNRDGYVFTEVNTVVNACQYAAFDAMAKIADVLGRTADAKVWRGRAAKLAAAMRETLLDAPNGRFVDGIGTGHGAQHATAYPVALGVAGPGAVPDEVLAALGETLTAGGMKVSVYGAQFLLDALFAAGRAEDAIGLMTATGMSGWLHMMDDLGATIVAEAWDPSLKPNMTFSHAWGSAPANVVPRHVLGVRVTAPGAAEIEVRPRPGGLTRVEGRVPTVRGPVSVELRRGETRRNGRYRLDVDVPPNTSARVVVELGDDDPRRYRVTGPHAHAPRATGRDVTGRLLTVGPVGSGRVTVIRTGGKS
ncbi:family 78 glycoside hydrolase catalytic domain [Actinomadura sp. WMMB 499]|uniref:family 78 glycoside hydrolase catalytic domain n=1 Tax=Actinomadura sp. WMMB 499 TaxID=1219491 RepID=UPI001246FDFF|nr:family 78 glycoside hydrolase catalytic domain [Actinomadura sp. WMMB 499]QFG20462.1 Bacterial alpha-L-rhamnosidase [Actinomadura sp. WMMB 499]